MKTVDTRGLAIKPADPKSWKPIPRRPPLVLVRLPFGFFVVRDSIFIDSCFVHWIEPSDRAEGFRLANRPIRSAGECACGVGVCVYVPSLVEVNEKHYVVSETGQSVGRWHGDDEGKHVIDEGIECLATISQSIL